MLANTSAAMNQWVLWCFAFSIAGFCFLAIGLLIGRRYWKRFQVNAGGLNSEINEQNDFLDQQQIKLEAIRQSLNPLN